MPTSEEKNYICFLNFEIQSFIKASKMHINASKTYILMQAKIINISYDRKDQEQHNKQTMGRYLEWLRGGKKAIQYIYTYELIKLTNVISVFKIIMCNSKMTNWRNG